MQVADEHLLSIKDLAGSRKTGVSSQRQDVLTENVTRVSLGEASPQGDLLENIWKLENLFQNHSDWLQRLEILIKWFDPQSLELELRSVQANSLQAEGYLVQLDDRETSGQVSRLREKLDDVSWTVGAVNHTFSNDISIHHLKIQDLQNQNGLCSDVMPAGGTGPELIDGNSNRTRPLIPGLLHMSTRAKGSKGRYWTTWAPRDSWVDRIE
ncbi:hypothetical protein FQN60_005361, partial [Etheostoma spectabile]